MQREARPLARALHLRRADLPSGPAWHRSGLVLAVAGVGPGAGERVRRILADVHLDRVLICGVAGALDPSLSVGDVLVPDVVLDVAAGAARAPHPRGAPPARARRVGALATVTRFGDDPGDDAAAVDLETAAIAGVCEEGGIPWDVRRAVSDRPGTVHPAVAALVGPDGSVDARAVIRLLSMHPTQIATLVRLGRDMQRALRALASVVAEEVGSARDGD